MDTKKVIVTLPVSLYNYALRQGKNLNEGIVKIIRDYRDMDAENITSAESVMDAIADVEVEAPSVPKLTKSVMDELDKVSEEVATTAEESGSLYREEKDKAVFFEYSEYSYAIVGDTKERREIIKAIDGAKFVNALKNYKNASGWVLPKKQLDSPQKIKDFVAQLEKTGLQVMEGESVYVPETPKSEEKPKTKVLPMKKKETAKNICFEPAPKGSSEEYSSVERKLFSLPGGLLYYSYDKNADASRIYFKVGHDDEENNDVYCMISTLRADAATAPLKNKEQCDFIAQHGVLEAYKQKKIKMIHRHMVWAYAEIGDVNYVESLESAVAV